MSGSSLCFLACWKFRSISSERQLPPCTRVGSNIDYGSFACPVAAKVARELEEQTLDGAGLRQLLVLKNRELRNVRKLSQYILDQRNEVGGGGEGVQNRI